MLSKKPHHSHPKKPATRGAKRIRSNSTSQQIVVPDNMVDAQIRADDLDLSDIIFQNANAIETLTIFAMTLEVSGHQVKLPGKTVTIVADRFLSETAVIELATSNFFINFRECPGAITVLQGGKLGPNLDFLAGRRYLQEPYKAKGGLQFMVTAELQPFGLLQEVSTKRLYRYVSEQHGVTKDGTWNVYETLLMPLVPPVALKQVALLAQPSVLTARIHLLVASKVGVRKQAREFLRWLGESSRQGPREPAKDKLLTMVSDTLLKDAAPQRENYVPFFGSQVYLGLLNNLFSSLTKLESDIGRHESTKTLHDALLIMNQNIVENGKSMVDFVKAVAEQEGALSKQYQGIINDSKKHREELAHQIKECGKKADEWNEELKAAIKHFNSAYVSTSFWDYVALSCEMLGAIAGAMALSVATAGVGAAAGVAAVAATAAHTAHKLEQFAKLIEALGKILEYIRVVLEMYGTTIKQPELPKKDVQLPVDALWSEALENFEAALPTGKAESERSEAVAAFRNLATWTKTAASLAVEHAQLLVEEKVNDDLRQISSEQRTRLLEIKSAGKQILPKDWTQVFVILQSLERSIQIRLIETFLLLERAHRYEFATAPVRLDPNQLGIFYLRDTLDKMGRKLLEAWGGGGSMPTEVKNLRIKFENRSVAQFENGSFIDCEVTVRDHLKKVFNNFAMIRVQAVRVELSAKASKKSKTNDLRISTKENKEYIIEWKISGNSFYDVPIKGDPIELTTDPMSGTTRYACKDNQLKGSTTAKWWKENTLHISPFTTWQIGIPDRYKETNEGVKLWIERKGALSKKRIPAEKIDVTLVFDIQSVTVPRIPRMSGKQKLSKKQPHR